MPHESMGSTASGGAENASIETTTRNATMDDIEDRLGKLENAYRDTLARALALETVCLALLPTVCCDDPSTARVLAAAEAALKESLQDGGTDEDFTAHAVTWFRRMRIDAVISGTPQVCH